MNMFVRSTRNYKEWTINIHILRTKVGPDYFFSLELKGRDHFLYCILRSDQKYFETSTTICHSADKYFGTLEGGPFQDYTAY